MPDFRLKNPETGNVTVTGDPGEKAQLLAQGYVEDKPKPPQPVVKPEPKPEVKPELKPEDKK